MLQRSPTDVSRDTPVLELLDPIQKMVVFTSCPKLADVSLREFYQTIEQIRVSTCLYAHEAPDVPQCNREIQDKRIGCTHGISLDVLQEATCILYKMGIIDETDLDKGKSDLAESREQIYWSDHTARFVRDPELCRSWVTNATRRAMRNISRFGDENGLETLRSDPYAQKAFLRTMQEAVTEPVERLRELLLTALEEYFGEQLQTPNQERRQDLLPVLS